MHYFVDKKIIKWLFFLLLLLLLLLLVGLDCWPFFCVFFLEFLKANWLGVYPKITIRSLRFVVTPKRSLQLILLLLLPSIHLSIHPFIQSPLLMPHTAYGQERTEVVQTAGGQDRVDDRGSVLALDVEIVQRLQQQLRRRRRVHLIEELQMDSRQWLMLIPASTARCRDGRRRGRGCIGRRLLGQRIVLQQTVHHVREYLVQVLGAHRLRQAAVIAEDVVAQLRQLGGGRGQAGGHVADDSGAIVLVVPATSDRDGIVTHRAARFLI